MLIIIYKCILAVISKRYSKLAGTEIFHSNGQTETGSETVFITMILAISNPVFRWESCKGSV